MLRNLWNKYFYNDCYIKINKNFIANMTSKCGCSTVALQGVSYARNLDISKFNIEDKHLLFCDYDIDIWNTITHDSLNINIKDIKNEQDVKVIVIYRDPVERFISAWSTKVSLLYNMSLDDAIERTEYAFSNKKVGICCQHFMPQYLCVDFDKVDIFVKLQDYKDFCLENNIHYVMSNKNNDEKYLNFKPTNEQINKIKMLYKEDYIMIKNIENSNKLYINGKY